MCRPIWRYEPWPSPGLEVEPEPLLLELGHQELAVDVMPSEVCVQLDSKLNLKPGASKKAVEQAMKDHVLSKAELVGRFAR